MLWQFHNYELDTDPDRINIDRVYTCLATTYWSNDRNFEDVRASWINSQVVFGLYDLNSDSAQVGFARVVTDTRTFGWLSDVFVDPNHRGQGLGKFSIQKVTEHPDCANLRLFVLGTRDAHGLYAQFGWGPPTYPERFMVRCL